MIVKEQHPETENVGLTKEFTGNGAGSLRVPGCLSIHTLWIDGAQVAPTETRIVREKKTGSVSVGREHEVEMYRLETGDDGVPILYRSKFSNDGIFQLGSRIVIAGEFVDTEAVAPPRSTAAALSFRSVGKIGSMDISVRDEVLYYGDIALSELSANAVCSIANSLGVSDSEIKVKAEALKVISDHFASQTGDDESPETKKDGDDEE